MSLPLGCAAIDDRVADKVADRVAGVGDSVEVMIKGLEDWSLRWTAVLAEAYRWAELIPTSFRGGHP